MNQPTLEQICSRKNPAHELYLRYVSMGGDQYLEQTKFAYTRGMLFMFNLIRTADKLYMNVLHDGMWAYLHEGKQFTNSVEKKIFKMMKKNIKTKKLHYILNTVEGKTAAFYGMLTMYTLVGQFKDSPEADGLIAKVIENIVEGDKQ
jgi:hypothetical protein